MAITFTNLTKNYGKITVLHDINLSISTEPAIIGLIGPNGVGKSTMLRMLAGVLVPNTGKLVNDKTAESYSEWASIHTSFVASGERGLRNRLTTIENLQYFGSLKGINLENAEKTISNLANSLGFTQVLDKWFQELSTGQKKMAAILVGAAMGTEVLLLDEPSNGLDIAAQEDLADFILQMKNMHHKLIFISSHDTQMLAGVVDHYVFLKNGIVATQINHQLTEEELIAKYRDLYQGRSK